jgi:hypothetical protein
MLLQPAPKTAPVEQSDQPRREDVQPAGNYARAV